MITNERGIALVITLLVVALLTIIVFEFTDSVEVDQRMARNALNGLQASLLARSGINLGEAFLLHDQDNQVDAFTEDWCPQPGPDAHSCRIDEANSQMVVPENMRLRVEIFDESGKVNLNLTRPQNLQQLQQQIQQLQSGAKTQTAQGFMAWYNAVTRLFDAQGLDPQVGEDLLNYWQKILEANQAALGTLGANAMGATAQAQPVGLTAPALGGVAGTPTPGAQQIPMDFASLDDASIIPGLTPAAIRRLRPFLTVARVAGAPPRVNLNTAPRGVLMAIVNDGDTVENIISMRQDQPLKQQDLAAAMRNISDPTIRGAATTMAGVTSSCFQIRASALVNPNPVTGRGGIGRTASMLVCRKWWGGAPNVQPPAGIPRWTLTRLDWQKEGGAALFQKADQGDGTEDSSTTGMAEQPIRR